MIPLHSRSAPVTKWIVLICAIISANAVLLSAGEGVASAPATQALLSWDDAVRIARENNPDLQAAKLAVDSAELSWRAAGSDYFPQLSAGADYSRTGTETRLSGGGTSNSTANSYSGALTVQQSLFSGFKTLAGREIARARFESARMDLALAEAALALSLRNSFIDLLNAQENIILLNRIRDRRVENKRLIKLRFEAGRENRGSYLRAAAQLSQAEFEAARAMRGLKVSQRELAQSLGQDFYQALAVTGTFTIDSAAENADIGAIARQTPDYKKQETIVAQARSGVTQARSGFFPSLSANASGRRRGSEFPLDTDSWSIGLSATYPIFSGMGDWYNQRKAKAELQKSSVQLESVRRGVETTLESAYAGFWDALGASEVQRQFLTAAEERAQIARAQYSTGLISFQDWDIIESDLINTQKQNLSALRDAATAGAAWKKAQGKGF